MSAKGMNGHDGSVRKPHGQLTRPDPEYQTGGRLPGRHSSSDTNVTLKQRLEHFTWAWFTFPMSTGGIALLLSVQPHTFDGLRTIGKVVYIFDLVVFLTLTSLMATRFILFPHKLKASLTNATESLFIATFFLSMPTIIGGMQQYGVSSTGPWLIVTLRVLFWLYVAITFLLAVTQYTYLFTGLSLPIQSMTPAWVLPIFPVMLSGTIASLISPDQPPDQRMAILVAGATFQGLGFWTTIIIYSIYMLRMMEYGMPGPNLRPGMFIAVGPPCFTGLALIGMARSLPEGYGYFITHPTAIEALQQLALAFAIFIWSLALFFFFVSAVGCLAGIRKMSFHLVWWAFIFPNTGFTIVVIEIGRELHSPAISWVGTALTLCLITMYLFVFVAHIRAVVAGDIMWPGKDEDKDE